MGLLQISEVRTPSRYKIYSKKKNTRIFYSGCCDLTHLPFTRSLFVIFSSQPHKQGDFDLCCDTITLHSHVLAQVACALNFPFDTCLNITKNVKNNSFFFMAGKGIDESLQKPKINNKTWKLALFLLLNHQIATFKRTEEWRALYCLNEVITWLIFCSLLFSLS